MMDRKKLTSAIPFLVAISSVAVALWISGMQISGSIVSTAGTQPDLVSFVEDLNLTGANYTFNKTYNNPNGEVTMTFSQDVSGINSTSANCVFEEDKDLLLGVLSHMNGDTDFYPVSTNPTVDLVAGDNVLTFRASPHENRCGLNGSYEINGVIA